MVKKKTNTDKLRNSLEGACSQEGFPEDFLIAMRLALESGLSCEQITATILLLVGVKEAEDVWFGIELVERAVQLMDSMKRRHRIDKDGRDCSCTFDEWKRRTGHGID